MGLFALSIVSPNLNKIIACPVCGQQQWHHVVAEDEKSGEKNIEMVPVLTGYIRGEFSVLPISLFRCDCCGFLLHLIPPKKAHLQILTIPDEQTGEIENE